MTLAITANIILAAIVFTAIVGLLAWAIQTSRQPRLAAQIKRSAVRQRRVQPRASGPARSTVEYQAQ